MAASGNAGAVATKSVLVPVANGSEEIETVGIVDTLRRAGASVTVASVEGDLQVTCSRGVRLVADRYLRECVADTFDAVALPGTAPLVSPEFSENFFCCILQ
jgi:protein deglycase